MRRREETSPAPSWLDRPQRTQLRRALYQLHLWIGLVLGVYIVVISVSGSAAVFRREVSIALIPRAVESVGDARLEDEPLRAALAAQYPQHRVVRIGEARRLESLVQVTFERNGAEIARLVDPYTGEVVGDPYPPGVRLMEWTVKLHDELLIGDLGRKINGALGILVAALVVTGAVLWWPGRRRWPLGLIPRWGAGAPRWTWQLHAMLGFWGGLLLFSWAVTGIYFGYPQPFDAVMNRLNSDPMAIERPGEALLLEMIRLHFGRFGGLEVRITWAVLGLIPAVLFVTGFTVWWRRKARQNRRGVRALFWGSEPFFRGKKGSDPQKRALTPKRPR
jgi:uncharacterized iron-regulated membrane protein